MISTEPYFGSRMENMPYKVLIVDDSKLARMSINRLLVALRPTWSRIEATNATDAIACQSRENCDMALLDFNMPGPDGLMLATELHALKPGMPLAIISANAQDEIVARAKSIGADFLPKPLTQQVLASFLDAVAPAE
jgi:DNA-binding NarL/FixJ family response regulator